MKPSRRVLLTLMKSCENVLQFNSNGLLDVVKVNHFYFFYLLFLNLNISGMPHLVSIYTNNANIYIYIYRKRKKKCSGRQVWCNFHNLDKWFEKYCYCITVCTKDMTLFWDCSDENHYQNHFAQLISYYVLHTWRKANHALFSKICQFG